MKSAKAKGAAKRGQLQEEIAFLRIQLASAEEERDTLRKELKEEIGALPEPKTDSQKSTE